MAFQPVPNVAQCRVMGRVDNQLTINNLFFEISGGGITATNLLQLVQEVDNWAAIPFASPLSDDWLYERTDGIDLSAADGVQASSSTPQAGGSTSEAAPNNVAACVSFRSGFAGRSFRGRNYVPGIPNDQITLNTMDSGFMATLLTTYGLLIGPGTFLAGWQWGVVSRRSGGAARPFGIISPINSVVFSTPYVRSMRSREIGHGA